MCKCRAVAAAVFGTSANTVDFVVVTPSDRFINLDNGTVDVLAGSVTYTMERDVYEVRNFLVPFGGNPMIGAKKVSLFRRVSLIRPIADNKEGVLLQYSLFIQRPHVWRCASVCGLRKWGSGDGTDCFNK
jgi:hypothetical protein